MVPVLEVLFERSVRLEAEVARGFFFLSSCSGRHFPVFRSDLHERFKASQLLHSFSSSTLVHLFSVFQVCYFSSGLVA